MSKPTDLKILIINHLSDNPGDDARVALSPGHIKMVGSQDINRNGRDLKNVTIHFADGEVVAFTVSGLDLMTLEEVIAGYDYGY